MRIRQYGPTRGQALIEFALVLPLLLVLIVNVVNFGTFFFAWITVANAARTGAQYMSLGGASVGSPRAASSSQIYNLIAADISSLPNRDSLAVRVCSKKHGVAAVCSTTGSGSFADPTFDARSEARLFVMGWVDVSYAYVPPIPGFSFPSMGVYATLPPMSIHRQSVMRLIQ